MAESFTSYVLENDKIFKAKLDALSAQCDDLRIPFGLISSDFYKSEQAIFSLKTEGKYPPFQGPKDASGKTKYQLRKIDKYGFDYPLLVAKGGLSNSLLGPNNRGSINKITPLSLVIGSSIPYLIFHQSDRPRKKLPQRKAIFIGPEAPRFATSDQMGRVERWTKILGDHLDKQIKRQGFK